jgi:Divergent InlB B-repeat domain/SMP-30/Gluconolactonase/LRE-like region/NHL repeat
MTLFSYGPPMQRSVISPSCRAVATLCLSGLCILLPTKLSGQVGTIITTAGTGQNAYSGDNGTATSAAVNQPFGIALDVAHNAYYIADTFNHRIRRVDGTTHIITTYAGIGLNGYASTSGGNPSCPNVGGPDPGDGVVATKACLSFPQGVAVDGSGNLYIADTSNNRIRRVDVSTKIITTYAGGFQPNIGYCGDGMPATQACLSFPAGLAWDTSTGTLYIVDTNNNRIRHVDSSGIISTVAGNGTRTCPGDGIAVDGCLYNPEGIAVDSKGQFYIADWGNNVIWKVDTSGNIVAVAGTNGSSGSCADGSAATGACLAEPNGVAIDDTVGRLYIADKFNLKLWVVQNGIINTVAGTGNAGSCPDGVPATQSCVFPTGVAITSTVSPAPTGFVNIYIASQTENKIRGVRLPFFSLAITLTGSSGGTVTSNPNGVACPSTCSANFLSNSTVTLTATAINGWIFSGWSGACTGLGTCTVSMTAPKSVRATFSPVLTVSVGGTGAGTIVSNPIGISCPGTCARSFSGGTGVTLTGTAASGATFGGWGGACTGIASCTVTMNAARLVTATFTSSVCSALAAGTCTITSLTVATSPSNRTRTTIGVGEVVNLTSSGSSATWSWSGVGRLNMTSGHQVTYSAGAIGGTATITASDTVGKASITFTVIPPSIAKQAIVTGSYIHKVTRPDIGFHADTYLGPDTVSFYNVWWKELEINATATGVYSCYGHGTGHGPGPPFHATTTVVKGFGTLVALDLIYSGDCATPTPFAPGYEQFNIPWQYSLSQLSGYRGIATVVQSCTLAPDASTLKASKATTSVTKSVSSPSHSY